MNFPLFNFKGFSSLIRYQNPKTSIIIFDEISKYLQIWNLAGDRKKHFHEFNDEMKHGSFSSVSLGNSIYVLTEQSLYLLEYDEAAPKWQRVNYIDGRHGSEPPAVAISGSIYVVGTAGSTEQNKSVSKYDPSSNGWERLEDKNMKTKDSTIVASKEFIYSIGGDVEGVGATDRVERLNIITQTWDGIAPLIERRTHSSGAGYNEKIIVAGGMNHTMECLSSIEEYDPDVNQWTIISSNMQQRWSFRLHLLDGNIVVVGGDTERRNIDVYDSSNDRWSIIDLGSDVWICESVKMTT